jgi:hypothetical protein
VLRFFIAVIINFLWLSVCATPAVADTQMDAYRAETLVANQSEAERVNAAKNGLGDVLVRATGDVAVLQHPLVREAINNAPNYLLKFSYTTERDNQGVNGVKLMLNYSPQAVQKLLREADILPKASRQSVLLQIANVQDFSAFKQVQIYLKTITLIRHSELIRVNQDTLLFSLLVEGDAEALKNNLALSEKLRVDETAAAGTAIPTANALVANISPLALHFRWQVQ